MRAKFVPEAQRNGQSESKQLPLHVDLVGYQGDDFYRLVVVTIPCTDIDITSWGWLAQIRLDVADNDSLVVDTFDIIQHDHRSLWLHLPHGRVEPLKEKYVYDVQAERVPTQISGPLPTPLTSRRLTILAGGLWFQPEVTRV